MSEINVPYEYIAQAIKDSAPLPLALLRRYRDLELNEQDAIRLLRLVAPCWQSGSMRIEQVMAEFEQNADGARVLLLPFVQRRFLEYDADTQTFSCEGLRRQLYLLWAADNRGEDRSADLFSNLEERPQLEAEQRRQIHLLASLYRSCERELGRPLKYTESELLRSWLDEYNYDPSLIEEAIKRAVLQNKCSFAYVGSILRRWEQQNLTTLDMVMQQDVKAERPAARSVPSSAAETKPEKTKRKSKYQAMYETESNKNNA